MLSYTQVNGHLRESARLGGHHEEAFDSCVWVAPGRMRPSALSELHESKRLSGRQLHARRDCLQRPRRTRCKPLLPAGGGADASDTAESMLPVWPWWSRGNRAGASVLGAQLWLLWARRSRRVDLQPARPVRSWDVRLPRAVPLQITTLRGPLWRAREKFLARFCFV